MFSRRKLKIPTVRTLKKIKLNIADIVISFSLTNKKWRLKLTDNFKPFIIKKGKPYAIFKIHYDYLPNLNLKKKEIFTSSANWNIFKKRKKWIVSLNSPLFSEPYLLTAINPSFKYGKVYINKKLKTSLVNRKTFSLFALNYPLGEILMINLLSKKEAV